MEPLTVQEKIELYLQELQNADPTLTDTSEGSIIDHLAGVTAIAVDEAERLILDRFLKTNFLTAEGQDLEDLAIDHFGDDFARPEATKATGLALFSRPTADAGDVTIPIGTIIRTVTDANGENIRFITTSQANMTGLSVTANFEALEAGVGGNVLANKITVIESTLTDNTITVNNPAATSGGAEIETDIEYRETILQLLAQLPGATKVSIENKAKSIAGIDVATLIETYILVSEIDNLNNLVGDSFQIPKATLYVGDETGLASPAQIEEVKAAIEEVRAAGVNIIVVSALPVPLNWSATITLNISGPNYAELSNDPQPIIDTMTNYINNLPVASGFTITDANNYILGIWGSAGSNDITDFVTSIPSGNVSVGLNQKLIAGTVSVN